jgi:hypothetical protein
MKKLITICLAAVVLVFSFSTPAPAVIETFNDYPLHTNTTTGNPLWIYGDAPTNSEKIAAWGIGDEEEGMGSAGIGTDGIETYAFGAGSGENPGIGAYLSILDVGMQDWGITNGIIADYLGPDGRDLHGGWMDVRTLLSGFTGQIKLGFVSDREVPDDEESGRDEFEGPIFDVTDFFAWYHGDLDGYISEHDGTTYADSPGVKVLGVWITLYSNTADGDIAGELQVDQIELVPEPGTIALLGLGALSLIRRKSNK